MKEKSKEITKKSLINNTIQKHPELAEDFFKLGMMCIGCPMSQVETIEQGCQVHGFTDKQIDKFIEILNQKIKKSKKKKSVEKSTKSKGSKK